MAIRKKKKQKVKKNSSYIFYLLYVIFFFFAILLYVFQHVQAMRYGYAVEEKRKEAAVLRMEHDRIIMEIQQYASLPRLESLAKKKLGLTIARQQDIIVMNTPALKKTGKKESYISRLFTTVINE